MQVINGRARLGVREISYRDSLLRRVGKCMRVCGGHGELRHWIIMYKFFPSLGSLSTLTHTGNVIETLHFTEGKLRSRNVNDLPKGPKLLKDRAGTELNLRCPDL